MAAKQGRSKKQRTHKISKGERRSSRPIPSYRDPEGLDGQGLVLQGPRLMCAPEIRSSVDRPDYWVECRPCDFRSEDFLNFKDVAAEYAAHAAQTGAVL